MKLAKTTHPTRRLAATTAIAGWLAVAAMLALGSPGVRFAAAEEDTSASYADGLSCQTDPAADPVQDLHHVIENARRQAMLDHDPDASGGEDFVQLNNRGYNYGTPPGPDHAPIAAEAAVR